MDLGQLIRITFLILVIVAAQFSLRDSPTTSSRPVEPFGLRSSDVSKNTKLVSSVLSFPLINRSIPPHSDLNWAIKYLHLPTWSPGYRRCDSEGTEVSCYEVYRAAQVIQRWENSVSAGQTLGQVCVRINDIPFPDRLSMLYHGIQIAIATNRSLVTDHSKFSPLTLPQSVQNSNSDEGWMDLPTDYQFGCADVSLRSPKIRFSGASWPQVLYTHPVVAPFMRENFGYHAAYFLGNFLFGVNDNPTACMIQANQVIEGRKLADDNDLLPIEEYVPTVRRCGVDSRLAALVTNQKISSENFAEVHEFGEDPAGIICALRRLMSGKRIVHTFGSRIGFWATAMLGTKGGFVNGIDRICVNMTMSQQGSLWHTFLTPEKRWGYRTNSWFYVCGPNVDDARSYIEYLLW